ncbi:MAG: ABC transporter ATP-binding protein [Chloroflexi bacterium]|nr:MAG: ABC transporter ATP-binding protein [Chloroflexota bacterium]
MTAIEARSLTKQFSGVPVLDRVTFAVEDGAKIALIGANGAGKSTLLSVLSTLALASSGTFQVGDIEADGDTAALRRKIGVLAHSPMLYEELTPLENLRFFAKLYGVTDGAERAQVLLERVGLWRRRDEATHVLSRGMHQRLAIARALIHRPSVLLLDEPETGLDQDGLALLDEEVLRAPGMTVLAATHMLDRIEAWADGRITLVRGRVATAEGTGVRTAVLEAVQAAAPAAQAVTS